MKTVGIDIIEIERIQRVVSHHQNRFLERIFTEAELAVCQEEGGEWRVSSLAARFAAKEAFYKAAFPIIRRFIGWKECEVLADREGVPFLRLSRAMIEEMNLQESAVSLSHSKKYAVAVVFLESSENKKR